MVRTDLRLHERILTNLDKLDGLTKLAYLEYISRSAGVAPERTVRNLINNYDVLRYRFDRERAEHNAYSLTLYRVIKDRQDKYGVFHGRK